MKTQPGIKLRSVIFFSFAMLFVTGDRGWAIMPPYISDESLARQPIIVVAKWEGAPLRSHVHLEKEGGEDVVTKFEGFTKLRIVRVIKGNIAPGVIKIKLSYGISWSADGKQLNSGTSTEVMGDVDDVSKLNIWFLSKERSWDKSDTNEYLSVINYRSIQPVALEKFYSALGSGNPEVEVPKLLASKDAGVVTRTLRFICGDELPSLEDDLFGKLNPAPAARGKMLTNEAEAVRLVIERRGQDSLRTTALRVYAKLKGKEGVQPIRDCLRDQSPDVRAMAISTLADWRDEPSIDPIIQAVDGISSPGESCRIIKLLGLWSDDRLVPAIIGFLQNDESAGCDGENYFIPALQAREALAKLTGHQFPFDVQSSKSAWEIAKNISDRMERTRKLAQLQPDDPFPIKAEVIGNGSVKAKIRVYNNASQRVVITRRPIMIDQSWPSGLAGAGDSEMEGKPRLLTLRPGESVTFGITLDKSFLLAEPTTRKLTLDYTGNGGKLPANSWIGEVNAEFGSNWKEIRKMEMVENKWPNGKLKEAGKTVNGNRTGEWNFFNEAGDLIRIIDYTGGHGTAECNPEHPVNKGAGKR